ncbi:MAG: sulfotransferase [Cyanobacteria bacterium J06639_1]
MTVSSSPPAANSWLAKSRRASDRLQLRFYQNLYSARIALTKKPCQFLLILSHMRAGSSLLVHLLNTHPQVCGYGEAHSSYEDERNLYKLVGKIKFNLKQFQLPESIFVDKLLHDSHAVSPDIAALPNVKFLFLVREPSSAIASMLKLWPGKRTEAGKLRAIEYYSNYYIDRLQTMTEYARNIGDRDRMVFLTHAAMIHQTESAFREFQTLLDIDAGFSERYETTPATGRVGVGDPSERIASGTILRKAKSAPSLEVKPECWQAFESCRTQLGDRMAIVASAVPS